MPKRNIVKTPLNTRSAEEKISGDSTHWIESKLVQLRIIAKPDIALDIIRDVGYLTRLSDEPLLSSHSDRTQHPRLRALLHDLADPEHPSHGQFSKSTLIMNFEAGWKDANESIYFSKISKK